jgi:hypothetical protein
MVLEDEPQNLLSSMQNSKWGGASDTSGMHDLVADCSIDMLAQAAEEEEDE